MKWTLIFSDGCNSTQIWIADGDPQQSAISIIEDYGFLSLVAAIEGTPTVYPADSARTAECGLQGWPPSRLEAGERLHDFLDGVLP